MSGEQAKAQGHAEGVVKPAETVRLQDVSAGTATQMQVLIGPEDGAPHFAMRRFIMEKGGGIPTHTNKVEHEQYVLRGRAEVGIGDKVHEVHGGDVLYIPAGAPHYYKVIEAPFEFLCMVPNAPDKIEIAPEGAIRR
jgi:quercetin dioxygenase-like cupin family protein